VVVVGASVVAVMVNVPGAEEVTETADAGPLQLIVAAFDAHETVTLSLSVESPPSSDVSSEYVAVPPGATVAVVEPVGAAVSEKSRPLPERLAVCGLPVALSATERVAARAPVAPGLNVTEIVHVEFADTPLLQVSVSAKSEAFAPASVMPFTVSAVLLELVTVIVCDALVLLTSWLANVRLVGESDAVGVAAAAPVPISATVCGLPVALSATDSEAERAPLAAGLKTTLMVHCEVAATPLAQVSVSEKSEAFAPVKVMPLIVSAVLLEFESVTV
jgi:hypothetical protein